MLKACFRLDGRVQREKEKLLVAPSSTEGSEEGPILGYVPVSLRIQPPVNTRDLNIRRWRRQRNVAEKVNSRSFNRHRDYFKSLTLSNLGEPS